MGVTGLWSLLDGEGGCPQVSMAARDSQLGEIYTEMDGCVVALDLGLLLCRALTRQGVYDEGLDSRGVVRKTTFEKCLQLLRVGAVPVGVTEGKPPAEKAGRLEQRRGGAPYRCERSPSRRPLTFLPD